MKSKLVGYVRKSNDGNALRMSISVDAFNEAQKYTTQDGQEYVQLISNLEKIKDIVRGEREVTSICQIVEAE